MGILNNESVKLYKRDPVLSMEERINVLSFFNLVDKIIPNAPLTVDNEYIVPDPQRQNRKSRLGLLDDLHSNPRI